MGKLSKKKAMDFWVQDPVLALKLIEHDLTGAFLFYNSRVITTDKKLEEICQKVITEKDFEQIYNLYRRLHDAAKAIHQLEKYVDKSNY